MLVYNILSASRTKRNYTSKSKGKAIAYKSTKIVDLSNNQEIVGPRYITPLRC
jgi:hypothetical protein